MFYYMFRVLLNVLLHIPGDEKNQKQNHYWTCSVEVFFQHLFRLQNFSLIQIHPFNYTSIDWKIQGWIFSQKLNNYKTNKSGIFYSSKHSTAVHQDHTNLSQGYTSNPAQHSTVLHELLLLHSLQCFHCPSAAGTQGRCVLKCQAPWNTHTAEAHTKHWAVSCSLGIKRPFTAAS